MAVIRRAALVAAILVFWTTTQANAAANRCLAIAGAEPKAVPVALTPTALGANEVRITFVGHSTFRIESAGGITIATDYSGDAGEGALPDVVTMNHAHSTHYTDFPDKDIKHVLRGWNPDGGAANHDLTVGDVKIRNVPTNIRSWSGGTEIDGNSIFIFEVAGLCIGHLGHLHHELTPQHIGWIGRLDVVFVPVDGTVTLDHASMISVLKDLRASIIIPMHFFGLTTLGTFILKMREEFTVETSKEPTVIVSETSLPSTPKLLVLPGY